MKPNGRLPWPPAKTWGCLGVTFKPNTQDMREAPSLLIIPRLRARGHAFAPVIEQGRSKGENLLHGVDWYGSRLEGQRCRRARLDRWDEFRALDLKQVPISRGGN
jgi:UDPglucose 6-dehydrogenase